LPEQESDLPRRADAKVARHLLDRRRPRLEGGAKPSMPTNEGYVTVEDRVRLFYETAGDVEETLVVLNGCFLFNDFKYLAEGRTLIGLDLRNRGRSDYVSDASKLSGVQQDVEDIEAVRRHFQVDRMDLIAHSYAGLIPILYAMR